MASNNSKDSSGYAYVSEKGPSIWRTNDANMDLTTRGGTKGPTILKNEFSSGTIFKGKMHVTQSKVSSFDVITGHVVRFWVTLYSTHVIKVKQVIGYLVIVEVNIASGHISSV